MTEHASPEILTLCLRHCSPSPFFTAMQSQRKGQSPWGLTEFAVRQPECSVCCEDGSSSERKLLSALHSVNRLLWSLSLLSLLGSYTATQQKYPITGFSFPRCFREWNLQVAETQETYKQFIASWPVLLFPQLSWQPGAASSRDLARHLQFVTLIT